MRICMLVSLLLLLNVTGCSRLVRAFVDTQPRVTLSEQALADPAKAVGGPPTLFAAGEQTEQGMDPQLVRWAPMLVQGFQPAGKEPSRYAREDDAIGTPRLAEQMQHVEVDTSTPRMFARVEHATVNGVELKQLVYAFWYPRRPVGSIEIGSVDGGVLRITLDVNARPMVMEYTQPCGCFHGVFVSQHAETASTQQFGPPVAGRMHAVEPPITGNQDWVVRDVVVIGPDDRLVLYVSAGKHFCEAIKAIARDALPGHALPSRAYSLVPYDQLEKSPCASGGTASIFDASGRVIGAQRSSEQMMLSDLDHAGWPRHLDRMLIHWDKQRWTDPTLIQTHLQLASSMTGGTTVPSPRSAVKSDGLEDLHQANLAHGSLTSASLNTGRQMLLFTNPRCTGCVLTDRIMHESSRVHEALRSWNYQEVDTATAQGERLAATYRISQTPVLLGLDAGHEMLREDQLDTEAHIVHALRSVK